MHLASLNHVLRIRGVPRRVLAITAGASVAAVTLGALAGWPGWAYAIAAATIWAPLFFVQTAWTHRHYGWLAFFYLLVVTQSGHFMEHVAQMFQLHVLGWAHADARGVLGALDVEWVHLGFNSYVFAAVALLLVRFPRNPWLWITMAAAAWHQVEHTYIIATFLTTGAEGTPGLLAAGGRIGGGVGLSRPDLHFLYNVVETAPLLVGFVWQMARAHDTWLARAFPRLPEGTLQRGTAAADVVHLRPGDTLMREGEAGHHLYVIARWQLRVTRDEEHVATLGPGRSSVRQHCWATASGTQPSAPAMLPRCSPSIEPHWRGPSTAPTRPWRSSTRSRWCAPSAAPGPNRLPSGSHHVERRALRRDDVSSRRRAAHPLSRSSSSIS